MGAWLSAALLVGCASEPASTLSPLPRPRQVDAPSTRSPARDCRALTASAIGVSNLKITAVQPQPARPTLPPGGEPAHCLVTGALDERVGVDGQRYAIGFELRLPMAWNGRFFFQGGGGTDGSVIPAHGTLSDGRQALDLGYAVASTDGGHQAALFGMGFGLEPQARVDYGYRAVGALTPVAKKIIETFYGVAPQRSYFVGCSNGGRQAMVAAARFADQFDGYIAGNPGFNLPKAAVQHAWDTQQLRSVSPSRVADAFSVSEMQIVGQRILDACDALDGAADGMVHDIRGCAARFDFKRDVPTCSGARTGSCLSEAQKVALQKMMEGPKNSRGEALYADWPWDPGIAASGANFASWRAWKLENPLLGGRSLVVSVAGGSLPHIFVTPPVDVARGAPPGTDPVQDYLARFDFDTDAPKIYQTSGLFTESAMSFMTPPNPTRLETLQKRGKLIVYHGLADPVFSANDTIHWYDGLRSEMPDARNFARLFLVPGMGHCSGGAATDSFDLLGPLVDWVEKGVPPEEVIARRASVPNTDVPKSWSANRMRPLCAYPKFAVKKPGASDLEDAASFDCTERVDE